MRNPAMFLLLTVAILLAACAAPSQRAQLENRCDEPRPEVCTYEYRPVCALQENGARETYGNACNACADPQVVGYREEACAEDGEDKAEAE